MDGLYSGKIAGITTQIQYFWQSLDFFKNPFAILDIVLVALILYLGYLLLKETRALRIVYGIFILAIIFFVGKFFQLAALNYVLQYLFTMIIVAIPIVFQPELRAFLEKVGRAQIIGDFASLKRKEIAQVIKEITGAVDILSHNKIGALIVLTQKTGLREYIETGTKLDATVTQDLILSIFTPKTPLHDGAVIISGNKIIAAGCTLPLSEERYNFTIGTRHKAAIGLSQQSDAIIIVVSEERGSISLAYNGILSQNLDLERLEQLILEIMQQKQLEIKKNKLENKK